MMKKTLLALIFSCALSNAFADIRVIDGDTIVKDGEHIRIVGLDTPELKARCAREFTLAEQARTALAIMISKAKNITYSPIGKDRYNRTLSIVYVDGQNIATYMINNGYARPYYGGKRDGWCY